MELTQELVKILFDYHEDGYLVWKVKGHRITKGLIAGYLSPMPGGCRYKVGIKRKKYLVSRIVFLWHNGFLPKEIDHKDRNRLNNKINNLRQSTHRQNMKNRTPVKGSSSKYLGVHLMNGKYWIAQIKTDDKYIKLGSFKTEKEAADAYNKAAQIHHGEFANLNFIE